MINRRRRGGERLSEPVPRFDEAGKVARRRSKPARRKRGALSALTAAGAGNARLPLRQILTAEETDALLTGLSSIWEDDLTKSKETDAPEAGPAVDAF